MGVNHRRGREQDIGINRQIAAENRSARCKTCDRVTCICAHLATPKADERNLAMADLVTVNVPIAYRAWKVPEHATLDMPPGRKQDGLQMLPTVPVTQLAPEALDALAAQWLAHLYASVERPSPFRLKP